MTPVVSLVNGWWYAMTAPHRRPRRSSDEIRTVILRAARETFAASGYAGATTKVIAARAHATEATLFRIFGSKEQLFDQAVLAPFEEFLAEFSQAWLEAPIPGGTPEEVLPAFVSGIYELVRANRDVLAAMTFHDLFNAGTNAALAQLETLGETIAAVQGLPFDPRIAVRVATTTVVAVALLQDELFPPQGGIGADRIVAEVARMLVGSARYAPG